MEEIKSTNMKLFLTGASGLLGRAIMKHFMACNWEVFGTAYSRVGPGLNRVDITKPEEVENALNNFKPCCVIHCAAQRYPDKVDKDHKAAEAINVEATANLARLSKAMCIPMLYISTDYVFDGKSPPFTVDDQPNPVNMYGKTKLMGEKETLKFNAEDAGNLVLRIPVLYGPVEKLSESAVTVLLESVLDCSRIHKVSDYERRRPSHVHDIAQICLLLLEERIKNPDVSGIYHWCGGEVLTKYGMIQQMSQVFNLPCDHIEPSTEVSTSTTTRPYDTTLDISRVKSLFKDSINPLPFSEHIYTSLLPWVEKSRDKQ